MRYRWIRPLAILGCWGVAIHAPSLAAEELAELSLQQLLDVEISLDHAFDIFGALVGTQKVSVATGKRQDAYLAPAVTSVITAQDLEAMGSRTLSEALQTVPGLFIARDILYQPMFILRGVTSTNNPEMLVLINGEPLKGLESGNRGLGWRDMPINGIERIEIIRGPGSALYGADAFAGTINLITKTAADIEGTEFGARVGRYQTREGWLLHGERHGGFDFAATVEWMDTDGPGGHLESDFQTILDGMTGTQASHAPGEIATGEQTLDARMDISRRNWRFRLGYQGQRDSGNGMGIASTLDEWGWNERDRFTVDLLYDNPILTPDWHLTARLNYAQTHVHAHYGVYPPGAALPIEVPGQAYPMLLAYPHGARIQVGTREELIHAMLSGFYAGWDRHLLRVGAGYRYEDLYQVDNQSNLGVDANGQMIDPTGPMVDLTDTAAAVYPEALRKSHYVFFQDTWHLSPKLDFTWGVRHDHYSDFGATTNPRAGLVWQATSRLTAKAMYGRAFRAPSFRELYINNNQLLAGNPDLEAEQIETAELAFNWRALDRLNLSLNLYRFTTHDTIQVAVHPDNPQATLLNAGKVDGHGLEWEARWKFNRRASLIFNHAWMDLERTLPTLEDERDQQAMDGSSPANQAYLRLDWLVRPKWYLNTQLIWLDEQPRLEALDTRPPMDPYLTMDATLRYKDLRKRRWSFAVGVRNLFNRERHSIGPGDIGRDVPLAGRDYFAEVRYRID